LTDQETVRDDYYTISASGVVHMSGPASPAEFFPLGEWVRGHSVFNMMKQVRSPVGGTRLGAVIDNVSIV
jgi:hypothetical protein